MKLIKIYFIITDKSQNKVKSMNEKLLIKIIYYEDDLNQGEFVADLNNKDDIYRLLLSFGNGIWDEVRIICSSPDAMRSIQNMLRAGGLSNDNKDQLMENTANINTLYRNGDEVWGGYIYIASYFEELNK